MSQGKHPWTQMLLDWWAEVREKFLIWRVSPGNTAKVNWAILSVVTVLIGYLFFRLWQSRTRRRVERAKQRRIIT